MYFGANIDRINILTGLFYKRERGYKVLSCSFQSIIECNYWYGTQQIVLQGRKYNVQCTLYSVDYRVYFNIDYNIYIYIKYNI